MPCQTSYCKAYFRASGAEVLCTCLPRRKERLWRAPARRAPSASLITSPCTMASPNPPSTLRELESRLMAARSSPDGGRVTKDAKELVGLIQGECAMWAIGEAGPRRRGNRPQRRSLLRAI